MNINDPFGRVKDRHQRNYESLCTSLRKANITKQADAEALLVKLHKRGRKGLVITVALTTLLMLALPKFRLFVLACGCLMAFWLSRTSLNSQEYIKRYIREELAEQDNSTHP